VAAIAVASLAVRAAFAARVGVFQDEALYWWSAQDSWVGFCPSPPAVALMVRWGEALLGPGVLGVRAGSLLSGTAGIILAAVLGWEFYGRRAAVWTAALFAVCPLMAATGSVATPEAPVVCLWLLFTWTTWRAAQTDGLAWWVVSGVVLAAGGYTKYMMALAVPCAFLALCASERGRRLLRRPGPWVVAALPLVLFVPVFLAWNARHGWAAVRFHLAARHQWSFEWSLISHYAVSHLAAVSPVICVGVLASFVALWRGWRRGKSWRDAWLLCFGLAPILFFLVPSLFTKRHMLRVHWDMIGYGVGIIALAGLIAGRDAEEGTKRRGLGIGALAAAAAIIAALFVGSFWPGLAVAAGTRPPTLKMLGWQELAAKVRELEGGAWEQPHFILTKSFGTALCLGFQRRSRDGIHTILHGRDRRYGLSEQLKEWRMDEEHFLQERLGHEAIYIHEFRHPQAPRPKDQPRRVYRYFEQLEPLGEVKVVIAGRTLRRFGLYRAHQVLLPP
jgi:dolichol-phosphate mannosyltransferase